MTDRVQTATISAQNTFCTALRLLNGGNFNISISGTWAGTVTLQRSFDGTNWFDVDSWTANIQATAYDPEPGVSYRLGIKTGNYTSGDAAVRVSQ